jgi:hypothetical protein
LKSGHDRTESLDSWFFSRDDFADVIPKFLKRCGLVGPPIHLLKYLHQLIEVLRVVAAKPVSAAFLEKTFNIWPSLCSRRSCQLAGVAERGGAIFVGVLVENDFKA